MPTNVNIEYIKAEEDYQKANSPEDKLRALKKMLSTAPTHKGAEKLRANIRKRISKYKNTLRKEKRSKKTHSLSIKKEGAGQVVFIGLPNSGKSTLLSKLSRKKDIEIAKYPFTTKKPIQRMIPFENIKLQGVEIPAIYKGFYDSDKGRELFGLIRNSDIILVVIKDSKELDVLNKEFKKANIVLGSEKKYHKGFIDYLPSITIERSDFSNHGLKKEIWKTLGKIRVQTKTAGKIAKKPIILKKGSTVEDAARRVHKDFIKKFRYARIWGPSAKFKAQQVGLDHKLRDNDVIEIFIK